ncbi:hypothetical protein BHE74_00006599 [Ensete ventricosum]|nr:hypothetical protein GW17_00026742 [Ensete ventricosum]RWW84777.1 hypothetical protein BHE74_00006599 [Ensete ventricosum]RZR88546.1 hypothetical protein BHM03_00016152 [Ensete ventricosum]
MSKNEYPNSPIYPAGFCSGSKTLQRNLMKDNSCQILTNMIGATENRLSASFPNKMLIEGENNVNLLGGNN